MNEENSFSQMFMVLLVQICFWVRNAPINFYPKLLLYFMLDFYMLALVFSEWFRVKVEWQIWVKKVWGELKNE
jgi:hypothetical protein